MPDSSKVGPKFRVALANLPFPKSGSDAVRMAQDAILEAGRKGAMIVCFPECFLPGYRRPGLKVQPPSARFLESAWNQIGECVASARLNVILSTERIVKGRLLISALVLSPDGKRIGFQDKIQLDPSEEGTYAPGTARLVFRAEEVTYGISICHEGFRYPETVRWPVRHGAQVVFHPHYNWAKRGGFRPVHFGDSRNTFHEGAMLCRTAENSCYFASVNYATRGSPTTSTIVNPDGTLLAYHLYGKPGLLVADLDLSRATRQLAQRYKPVGDEQESTEVTRDSRAPRQID